MENHNDDDEGNLHHNYPTPRDIASTHTLRIEALAEAVSDIEILSDFDLDHDILRMIATEILGKATDPVINPTRYVTKAIRTEPWIHQARALELLQSRNEAGGNLF